MRRIILLASVIFPVAIQAGELGRTKCDALVKAAERVQCHAQVAALQAPSQSASDAGQWRVRSHVDPLTHKTAYFSSLQASYGRGRWNRPVWLTARCRSDRTDLYINWGEYLGEKAYTTYDLDRRGAVSGSWHLAADRSVAFYPSSPIALLKRMFTASSFVVSVKPEGERPITAIFQMQGAETALSEIRKSCRW